MSKNFSKKSLFSIVLHCVFIVGLIATGLRIITNDELRERLNYTYCVAALAIIGGVIFVLAQRVWIRIVR